MKNHIFHSGLRILSETIVYLERSRIGKLLESALKSPYVTVTAGAGYGKTQAVYSFLLEYGAPTAWIQLSERDNLPTRFWENLARTLSLYNRRIGERMRELGFPETEDQFAKVMSIPEDELSPNEKYVVVFDDFHLIEDDAVLRFMKWIAQTPFPNVSLILISRVMPDIGAVSLMSKGLVVNINEDELRFTESETAEYFRLLGIPLSSGSVSDICDDTGGWAFAISLIGLSLKKAPSHEQNARIAMKLNVFKMIEDEVFLAASEGLRRFLIRLSLIDHLSKDLVLILAGDESLVNEMEKISAFIRFDIHLNVYLIHRLFLDYLHRKQDALPEEEKRDVFLKAARWCEANDYKTDAVSYYDKAGEYSAIVRIAHQLPLQIPFEQAKFILDIYDNAPKELLERVANYHAQHSRLLMSIGRYDEAIAEITERIRECSALPASDYSNQALCWAYKELGYASFWMLPHTDRCDFDVLLKKAYEYFVFSPYEVNASITSVSLGPWASQVGTARSGAMEEYIDTLTRAVPYSVKILNGCMYGLDDLARGELQFYKGNLKQAEGFITAALHKAEARNQYDIRNRALFYLMRIAVAQGNYEKIRELIRDLDAQLEMNGYSQRFISHDIVSGWYFSRLGMPQLVPGWLKGSFAHEALGAFVWGFGDSVKMKFYYADKRYYELLSFIESGQGPDSTLFGRLEMKVLEAVCYYQTKNGEAARASLREAYDLALSNELNMPFIGLGKDMRTLTAAAMRDEGCDIPHPWLEMINRKAATYAKRLTGVISDYRKANNIDDDDVRLSARETDVLNDLYHGLSRSEIAAGQGLSINTVKMILNAIYTKLGADNVADVIRIALKRKLV
jgi:LuxR family maltose regulon positive regulatory protein